MVEMKKILVFIWLLGMIILSGCDEPALPANPGVTESDAQTVDLVAGVMLPEMNFAGESRGMGDEPTVEELLNDLHVNLFVFDPSGVMLQFIGPEDISVVDIDQVNKRVYFKVSNIYSSTRPRRLHFVVTSAPDLHDIAGGDYISAMAGETTVMPALVVAGDTDAYWGIKELDSITEDMHLEVKLIRNFVKLSVSSSADPGVFKLLGYTVVNRPNSGTIAPYIYRDHLFASFFNPDNGLLDYDEIIAQGYMGVNPAGGDLDMTCVTEEEVRAALDVSEAKFAGGDPDTPCYIYERSQSSITSAGGDVMVTYVIVAGEYKGERCYYKIDIGRDKDGKFGFYDMLRNFQYTVYITEVGGKGSPTLIEAMNGAAHNNLSASVVTRDLFSIGYGGEMIEVSSTRVVFTEKTTDYSFRFRYTTPEGMAFDASKLKIYDLADPSVEFDMGGVSQFSSKTIELPGEVIETSSLSKNADGWYVLTLSTRDLPADSRRYEQNLRIYYSGGVAGLGRSVTFMLRRPWEFSQVTATSPGVSIRDVFSISFNLPSGLARTLFPLVLTFESDKQNIYAAGGSPLTVATGKSAFSGATTDEVISYEWRLDWREYSPADGIEGGMFTATFNMNTSSVEDRAYDTSKIDNSGIVGRVPNNSAGNFCVRIANKGQQYILPYYVNVRRD